MQKMEYDILFLVNGECQKIRKYISIHYHNMEVECLNDILVYLVMWLFGELCYVFTKLRVIVSVRRTGTASENYWAM